MVLKFMALYPEMVVAFIGVLLTIVGALASGVGIMLKDAIDRLNTTIKTLTVNHDELEKEVQHIDMRLVKHMTMCEVCRQACPEREYRGDRRSPGDRRYEEE